MPRYTFEQIRHQFGLCQEAKNPMAFPRLVAEQVGLIDKHGRPSVDDYGREKLHKERKVKPSDFNLQELTEAMLGRDWANQLGLATPGGGVPVTRWMRESGPAPVGPSFFMQVSAWSATVGGLMKVAMLEGYESPEYDMKDMFPAMPPVFWQGGERIVDIFGPNLPAAEVGPGEEYPDHRMDSMWVEPGPMKKYAGQLTLAKETAWVDITSGRILGEARTGGQTLAYRENELAIDLVTGQTNNFKLALTADTSATGYNTYGATISGNALGNDITNPMVDWTSFQAGDNVAAAYRHPVFGYIPINVDLKLLLVPTTLETYANYLNTAERFDVNNQPGVPVPAAPGGGTFPSASTSGPNPYRNRFTVKASRWLHARHTASTTAVSPNLTAGLGLTGNNVNRWYRLDPQKFARKRVAWSANVIDLNPSDYVLATRGIIAGQAWDIGVQMQVVNPWAIQRNKVS